MGIQEVIPWFSKPETAVHFLLATWAHHGKPFLPRSNFKPGLWEKNTFRDPVEGLSTLNSCMKNWFPEAFKSDNTLIPDLPVIQHVYNGILTLADWLGSDTRFFSYAESLENYMQQAKENAQKAICALTLDAEKPRKIIIDSPVSFQMITPWQPYEIQKRCLELPTYPEGSLTILESDTGSGKTEAALCRFLKLYQEGHVDGMYFAVPTRSAATQLYDRVEKAMEKAFRGHENRPPVVQAVTGYLKVDAVEGKALPHFKVLWHDDRNDLLRERSWAAEHPKRYLAGAVVVGTIDQVLLSTLQVRHAHMRTAALLRHFLVVDEVHSSDVYMTSLLGRVLDLHLSAGGHAFLMSATLGISSRYQFAMNKSISVPEIDKVEKVSYPLLTHTNSKREKTDEISGKSSGFQKNVRVTTKSIAGYPKQIAALASQKAGDGARVLVIRNKVSDCIETQQAIEEIEGFDSDFLFKSGDIPVPHHSRFAPEDRKKLDLEIESCFGKKTNRDSVIAVATQTVEQSLDIDADFMITDLCPMDVLLQRIGRLHRHQRFRPKEFETAQCVVLTPDGRDLGQYISQDGQARKGKFGLGTVYQDLRVLEATWNELENPKSFLWKIPDDNRKLVERSLHPMVLSAIVNEKGDIWKTHQQYIDGQKFADRQLPEHVAIDFTKPFGESGFNEDIKTIKTRLGKDDIHLTFGKPVMSPFGNPVDEITVADWLINEVPEKTEIPENAVSAFDGGFSFEFAEKTFTYNRFGLSIITE